MNTRKSEALRQRIRQWCQQVMDMRGWTPERWAKEAKIAPTTLTRFMNNGDFYYTLSAATLDKLAFAANVTLDFHHPAAQQVYVPVFRRPQLEAAIKVGGKSRLDIFTMTSDETAPVPNDYRDCRFVGLDNGRLALCRDTIPPEGKRAVVWCADDLLAVRFRVGDMLSPSETAANIYPMHDPNTHVFGLCVAELTLYEPGTPEPSSSDKS